MTRPVLARVRRAVTRTSAVPGDREPTVSILIVAFNAPRHLLRLFRSMTQTSGVDYEVVVVDNRSRAPTRLLLHMLASIRAINSLTLLDRNTLFAGGVNTALRVSNPSSRYVLLLNPDITIQDPEWLRRLLEVHARGATSLGLVEGGPWPRADGYCLLIDRDLFGGLSPEFHWWWGVTKLQADLLQTGHTVRAVRNHDHLITHTGGASGPPPRDARGMQTDDATIRDWFGGIHVAVIDQL
jgi:glycosyltransferase involved in cell wall biosynthesis